MGAAWIVQHRVPRVLQQADAVWPSQQRALAAVLTDRPGQQAAQPYCELPALSKMSISRYMMMPQPVYPATNTDATRPRLLGKSAEMWN